MVIIDDVQKDPGWVGSDDIPETMKIHGWLGVPLLMLEAPVGVLTLDSYQPNAYTQADAQLVLAFADQTASAVANARLYAESQQQTRTMALMAETTRSVNASL